MLPTPYVDLDRRAWSRLRENHPMSLEQGDLARLRGLGERLDLNEVEEVYLPLSRLLHFYVEATHGLRLATSEFLGERPTRVPFVVGVAGSVAVGKSTTAAHPQGADEPLAAARRASSWSRPTASCTPTPSSNAEDCCSARVFPSRTTGAP